MTARLMGGVIPGPDRRIWVPGLERAVTEPGTAVAVGPRDAPPSAVRRAFAELDRLVAAGGVLAAGADVDLGDGFRSARTDGAAGDRRDAVLAALTVPGLDADGRLGPAPAVLVALFGPAATKRVGSGRATGLLVPSAWLTGSGWQTLWARAAAGRPVQGVPKTATTEA